MPRSLAVLDATVRGLEQGEFSPVEAFDLLPREDAPLSSMKLAVSASNGATACRTAANTTIGCTDTHNVTTCATAARLLERSNDYRMRYRRDGVARSTESVRDDILRSFSLAVLENITSCPWT